MNEHRDVERVSTLVIGGGQAGLAMGYQLARRNLSFRILDANRRIGSDDDLAAVHGTGAVGAINMERLNMIAKIIDDTIVKVDFSKRPFTAIGRHLK